MKSSRDQLLETAYQVAQKCHEGQFRDDGSPFITHIDSVLLILKNEFHIHNEKLLLVATLHDTLEDSTHTTFEEIEKLFGEKVATSVKLLTKSKGQDFGLYLEKIDAYQEIPNLMLVKLADRLHNLRTMEYRSPEKIKKKCVEVKNHLLPYAQKFNPRVAKELVKLVEELENKIKKE